MSTFDGIVEEFPQIRIDYFRKNPKRPAPLACFLSHVHSDHLQGLESLRAPFIYCSAATREILLRLEKRPHRINFSKGILESRRQHYKHLSKLLRPIPLQVPTEIELSPRNHVRVTLFDANHCPGAVMFLIEGNGKTILYTGDIRAESWWVGNLIRNPVLIPYTLGDKRLDKIYLDTTFATKSDVYQSFPSKAEGIRELLEKINAYPEDTIFYLRVWTFGYEDIWLACPNKLHQIHVDQYQIELYKSLTPRATNGFGVDKTAFLCGFTLGNAHAPGCLTHDHKSRIHSCEPDMRCSTISKGPSVYITPIVSRTSDGSEIPELGAGGGQGDLYQSHELDLSDGAVFQQLSNICFERIKDEKTRSLALDALSDAHQSKSKSLSLDAYGIKDVGEISVKKLVGILSREPPKVNLSDLPDISKPKIPLNIRGKFGRPLPNTIRFPYSRHSSYDELCNFIRAFKPKDIISCTADVATWDEDVSMRTLFGHLCSGTDFTHDKLMREYVQRDSRRSRKRMRLESNTSSQHHSTQQTDSYIEENELPPITPSTAIEAREPDSDSPSLREMQSQHNNTLPEVSAAAFQETLQDIISQDTTDGADTQSSTNSQILAIKLALKEKHLNRELDFHVESSFSDLENEDDDTSQETSQSYHTPTRNNNRDRDQDPSDTPSDRVSTCSLSSSAFGSLQTITSSRTRCRMTAYRAARSGTYEAWTSFGSPVSAGNNHTEEEAEL
ncbi:hypothetical protein ACO22_03289 [Paracoccidioides brasiliensis]|uniref:Protein artemis n=1 Tax=Paracoccidioides brasiliensis TaxID=121759 RepID=A0A1D2JGB9_PARBR|nr:hypothetical protein ACO22_03289 [Paracoccidioides brasiliensis]